MTKFIIKSLGAYFRKYLIKMSLHGIAATRPLGVYNYKSDEDLQKKHTHTIKITLVLCRKKSSKTKMNRKRIKTCQN